MLFSEHPNLVEYSSRNLLALLTTHFLLREEMFEVDLGIVISKLNGMSSTEYSVLECPEEGPAVI